MTSSISERWRAALAALPDLLLAGAFASFFAAVLATPVVPLRRARRAIRPDIDAMGAEGRPSKGGLLFVNAVTFGRPDAN
jgi:hypothetical protein